MGEDVGCQDGKCPRGAYHITPPPDSPPECHECTAGDLRVDVNRLRAALARAKGALEAIATKAQGYADSRAITGGGYYPDGGLAHHLAVVARTAIARIAEV